VRVRPSRLAALLALGACIVASVAGVPFGVSPASAAPSEGAPLSSATETATGSWVVLPMGLLSEPLNTFWQVLHSGAGSSQWSVVTPEGVADNGGVVIGASPVSAIVGTLPSQGLRFSPLAASDDGGTSWSPIFLPGALAARPDVLADAAGTSGGSLAIVGATVLRARSGLTSWSPVVSLRRLGRASPRCDANVLDAVAVAPTGSPLVATGCRRGGGVAVFAPSGGSWTQAGPTLPRALRGWSSSVLRLESGGTVTTALVAARRGDRRVLVALWHQAGRWTASVALGLPPNRPLLASSVGASGTVAVVVGSKGTPVGYDLVPGSPWTRLPALPPATSALGPLTTGVSQGGPSLDAFTVAGTVLGVYALTPAGTAWVKIQSTQVPLAYGSSS
jgi:hypothetical protein